MHDLRFVNICTHRFLEHALPAFLLISVLCTVWSTDLARAQNKVEPWRYTSSVLRVSSNAFGSAVVVQEQIIGKNIEYILVTAAHLVIKDYKNSILMKPLQQPTYSDKISVRTNNSRKPLPATLLHPLQIGTTICKIDEHTKRNPQCHIDLALMKVTVPLENKLKVLPINRHYRIHDGVVLAGFPEWKYQERSTTIIREDFSRVEGKGGEQIYIDGSSAEMISGGAAINNDGEIIGIIVTSGDPKLGHNMTLAIPADRLCQIWGKTHLNIACKQLHVRLNEPIVPIPENKRNLQPHVRLDEPIVPIRLTNKASTPQRQENHIPENLRPRQHQQKSISKHHLAVVTIIENNKTVGYGVIFRKDQRNFYIASTATFRADEAVDEKNTLPHNRKNPLIKTNKNYVLKHIRQVKKRPFGNTTVTILIASTHEQLPVATLCETTNHQLSKTSIVASSSCIPYIPGNTLSSSEIRKKEICTLYRDVCEKSSAL